MSLSFLVGALAALSAAAAQGAALLAGADAATEQALRTFGLNLGIAFQLIDDVLELAESLYRAWNTTG